MREIHPPHRGGGTVFAVTHRLPEADSGPTLAGPALPASSPVLQGQRSAHAVGVDVVIRFKLPAAMSSENPDAWGTRGVRKAFQARWSNHVMLDLAL